MPDGTQPVIDWSACRALVAELVVGAGSQRKLAEACGLDHGHLSRFLAGKKTFQVESLRSLADHADLDLEDLIAGRRPETRRLLLALDQIEVRSADNPRQASGLEPADLRELAESIAAEGLLQPLVVTATGAMAPDGRPLYRLVAGERRQRALLWLSTHRPEALEIRLPAGIPCELRPLFGPTKTLTAALAENLARADLAPWEITRALAALQEKSGQTAKEIAAAVGLSERRAQQHLQIARELPSKAPQAWDKYLAGRLDFAEARLLVQERKETQTVAFWQGADAKQRGVIDLRRDPKGWRWSVKLVTSADVLERLPSAKLWDSELEATQIAGNVALRWLLSKQLDSEERLAILQGLLPHLSGSDSEYAEAAIVDLIAPPETEAPAAEEEPPATAPDLSEEEQEPAPLAEGISLPSPTSAPTEDHDEDLDDDEAGEAPLPPGETLVFTNEEEAREIATPPAPAANETAAEAACPVDLEVLREFVGDHHTAGLALAADALLQPLALIAIEPATVPQWHSVAAQANDKDRELHLRLSPVWDQFAEFGWSPGGFSTRADRLQALLELPANALCDLITAAVAERLGPIDPTGGELLRTLALATGAPLLEEEDDPRPAFLKAKSQSEERQDDD